VHHEREISTTLRTTHSEGEPRLVLLFMHRSGTVRRCPKVKLIRRFTLLDACGVATVVGRIEGEAADVDVANHLSKPVGLSDHSGPQPEVVARGVPALKKRCERDFSNQKQARREKDEN
jgi:hypothetical protein